MKRFMSIIQFEEYLVKNPFNKAHLISCNQDWARENFYTVFELSFDSISIGVEPPAVCFRTHDSQLSLYGVTKVLVDTESSAVGDIVSIEVNSTYMQDAQKFVFIFS